MTGLSAASAGRVVFLAEHSAWGRAAPHRGVVIYERSLAHFISRGSSIPKFLGWRTGGAQSFRVADAGAGFNNRVADPELITFSCAAKREVTKEKAAPAERPLSGMPCAARREKRLKKLAR